MRIQDMTFPDQPEVVLRTIRYHDEDVEAFFLVVDALKANALFDFMDNKGDKDMKKVRGADFKIIAAVCCKDDGTPLYTEDQAKKLPAPVKTQLATIAIEVNMPQKDGTPKN